MSNIQIPSELVFYEAKGHRVITVIIQDFKTREVLMLGHMTPETLALTIESGVVHFFRLQDQKVWLKGKTSGVFLKVKELRVNCNNTNLLILVEYEANICHDGKPTCFYRKGTQENGKLVFQEIV